MKPDKFEKYNVTLANSVNWILLLAGVLLFLMYFSSLLQPLVFGLLIWYLIRQISLALARIKVKGKTAPRWVRSLLSILIMLVILFSIGELLVYNLEQISDRLPQYEASQKKLLNNIYKYFDEGEISSRIDKMVESIEIRPVITNILNSLSSLLGNIGIVIIYMIFILLEESSFSNKLIKISESNSRGKNNAKVFQKMDKAISDYLNIKTIISLITGTLSYVVLRIFGIDFAFLWAFIIFLFNYIPYVGSLVATLLPAAFAVLQTGSLMQFVYVFAGVEAVQLFMGNYVEPKITGRGLNLSPLVVLIALSFWGSIWGILGMILSVPITSVTIIILAQFPQTKNIAIFLSETGDVDNLTVKELEDLDAEGEKK